MTVMKWAHELARVLAITLVMGLVTQLGMESVLQLVEMKASGLVKR